MRTVFINSKSNVSLKRQLLCHVNGYCFPSATQMLNCVEKLLILIFLYHELKAGVESSTMAKII